MNLQKKRRGDNHQIDCLLTPTKEIYGFPTLIVIATLLLEIENENPEWQKRGGQSGYSLQLQRERIESLQRCNFAINTLL